MKLFKSVILPTIVYVISVIIWAFCYADFSIPYTQTDFYYNYNSGNQHNQWNTDFWNIIKNDVITDENNAFSWFLSLFRLSSQSRYGSSEHTSKAIYYIKWIVNMMLWLTAFISLILVIFAFYLIFFSKGDAGESKAKQILKWVALALVVMWLSWFIVSLFFWIERGTTAENTNSDDIYVDDQPLNMQNNGWDYDLYQ